MSYLTIKTYRCDFCGQKTEYPQTEHWYKVVSLHWRMPAMTSVIHDALPPSLHACTKCASDITNILSKLNIQYDTHGFVSEKYPTTLGNITVY